MRGLWRLLRSLLFAPERLPKSVRNAYQPDKELENAVNRAIWEGWNDKDEQLPLF